MVSEKPKIKVNEDNNHLNSDIELPKLIKLLTEKVFKGVKKNETNEYQGQVQNFIIGGTNIARRRDVSTLKIVSADPFRDPDVDRERIRSKGIVDEETIKDRNVLYVYSEKMYNMDFAALEGEQDEIKASFLLRIPYSKSNNDIDNLRKNYEIIFSFKDRENLRDPWLVRKPTGQSINRTAISSKKE